MVKLCPKQLFWTVNYQAVSAAMSICSQSWKYILRSAVTIKQGGNKFWNWGKLIMSRDFSDRWQLSYHSCSIKIYSEDIKTVFLMMMTTGADSIITKWTVNIYHLVFEGRRCSPSNLRKRNKPLMKPFLQNAESLKNTQHLEKNSVNHLLFSLCSHWQWDFPWSCHLEIVLLQVGSFSQTKSIQGGLSNRCLKVIKITLLWIQLLMYDEDE